MNLAPADVKKEGAGFDLPIAIGILSALEVVSPTLLEDYLLLGEVSLDGRVKPIRGALSLAMTARENGKKRVLLPRKSLSVSGDLRLVFVAPAHSLRSDFKNSFNKLMGYLVYWCGPSLLPINNGHFGHSQHFGQLRLAEPLLQSPLSDTLPEGI